MFGVTSILLHNVCFFKQLFYYSTQILIFKKGCPKSRKWDTLFKKPSIQLFCHSTSRETIFFVLLHRHALRQVARFVNIAAAVQCRIVRDQLQRHDGNERSKHWMNRWNNEAVFLCL
jgi:hypothetical protein